MIQGQGNKIYEYDNLNRLIQVTHADGNITSYEYDAVGNRTRKITITELALPVVETASISEISATGATVGGNVISSGGAPVSERGVYWGTSPNPETTGNTLQIGSGIGEYSTALTGLETETSYYVKAYASNSLGISFGEQVTFVTLSSGVIEETIEISGYTSNTGTSECFNALLTISVSDLTVQNGAELILVAGLQININPNTDIQTGSIFRAYIDTLGNFCQQPESFLLAFAALRDIKYDWQEILKEKEKQFFSLFPNPTPGTFTLQLKEATESMITVEIYSMLGERILQTQLSGQQQYEFDLSGRPGGVYLIRVMAGEEIGVERLIKQ